MYPVYRVQWEVLRYFGAPNEKEETILFETLILNLIEAYGLYNIRNTKHDLIIY